jgi:hypothetical protein
LRRVFSLLVECKAPRAETVARLRFAEEPLRALHAFVDVTVALDQVDAEVLGFRLPFAIGLLGGGRLGGCGPLGSGVRLPMAAFIPVARTTVIAMIESRNLMASSSRGFLPVG